jgi:hypothetical protein
VPEYFWYQWQCNFCGKSTSRYGSDMQPSLWVTYLSRDFIKYSEHYTACWHFPWRSYSFQTLVDQSSTKNTEKIVQFQKNNSFVPTEEANNNREKRKTQEENKVKEQAKMESVNTPLLQIYKIRKCRKRSN